MNYEKMWQGCGKVTLLAEAERPSFTYGIYRGYNKAHAPELLRCAFISQLFKNQLPVSLG